MNNKLITKIIMNAEINKKINLSNICNFFTGIKFTYHDELGYSWIAYSRISVMNIFPMQTNTTVKFFKTFIGAKRNFLKRVID